MIKCTQLGITAIRIHKEWKYVPPIKDNGRRLLMLPFAKYLVTSILKHYLRYFFLKYLVSCNKILFFVNNSIL